jgi:hypothetical protein
MSYDLPTAESLKIKYPAFADVADATVDVHILDASTSGVDTSWLENDYQPAVRALAAHTMALLSIGAHGEVTGYAMQGVSSFRSGNFSASFDSGAVGAAAGGGFDATPYGREYYALLRKNKGGPRVAVPTLPYSYGAFDGPAWP